jgi:crotonobetainyl-CoA:carnitine CoA-transferase CaiB-like acyl-CoA transferase
MNELPYSGCRVLDMTQGVAGPHATMLLALNGADVIKVEPLGGDWARSLGKTSGDSSVNFIAFNRGKRSLSIDLKTNAGRAVIDKRVRHCGREF